MAGLPSVQGQTLSNPQASLGFRTALDRAEEEAGSLSDDYVATEHLLLALLDTPGPARDRLRRAASRATPCSPRCATSAAARPPPAPTRRSATAPCPSSAAT